MTYNYIKDKPGSVKEREAWVFELFDYLASQRTNEIERQSYQRAYDEIKFRMIGSYVNEPTHKYHGYLQELIRLKLVKKELLDYVLINNFDRAFFERMFPGTNTNANGITLGVAFPWTYPGESKRTGATAVHQIYIWDLEAWLEKTSKWYYRLFHWKRDYEPLHPDLAIKGLLLHELVHAKQYIIDRRREPPTKNGQRNYKNYLEREAFATQFFYLDQQLGYPEHLERWNAKTYEEAANNYLDYLTNG